MMRRVTASGALVILLAAALMSKSEMRAEATDVWTGQGRAWQMRDSNVALLSVASTWTTEYGEIVWVDCATFANVAPQTVTHVQVMFASVGTDGKAVGPLIPVDRPKLSLQAGAGHVDSACRDFGYAQGDKGRWLVAWVNAVTYADGAVWHAGPNVVGTALQAPGENVLLSNVVTNLPLRECADVRNESTKTITRVRFSFAHRSTQGNLIGSEPFDVRTAVSPGSTLRSSCRSFHGANSPDLIDYVAPTAAGSPSPSPPEIDVGGQASTLDAQVTELDFADGTVWRRQ